MFKIFSFLLLMYSTLNASDCTSQQSVNLLFFGAFFMIIIYNAMYLFFLKSATYASYLMFHITLFVIMLFTTQTLQNSWFDLNWHHVPVGIFFLSVAMFLAFSRDYFNLQQNHSKVAFYINVVITLDLGIIIFLSIIPINTLLEILFITLVILEVVALLSLTLYLGFYLKESNAFFYLASFAPLFLVVILLSLDYFSILQLGDTLSYLLKSAILIEASGLSFALSHQQKEREIKAKQDEVLLQELSHRVQNNLQQIISILTLQMGDTDDVQVKQYLENTINRITSIALIHKTLQHSSDAQKNNIHSYLENLFQAYRVINPNVSFLFECDKRLYFSVAKLTPLALIINELITNSLKHAFSEQTNPQICLKLTQGAEINFTYQDNGTGFSPSSVKFSTGTKLIKLLATSQLRGIISQEYTNGYTFFLRFPK